MATELKNIKRKFETAEASLSLLAKQWGYGEDTRRITVMEDDGTTRRYFWDSTRLADQTTTYGTALIGTPGIAGVTPTGGSAGAAATLQAMLGGGLGIANTNFISTVPNSSTRNLIQPSGDFYGIRLRNNAAQSNEILRIESSASARLSYVDASGHWYTNYSNVGSGNLLSVGNTDNTNTGSGAHFVANVGGASAGDPSIRWSITGVQTWSMGVDNSDSDSLVISGHANLGTNNALRISNSTLGVTIPGTLGVTGAVSLSSSLSFAAGQDILIPDNSASALTIAEGGNAYLRFVTTNSAEAIQAFKTLQISGGAGSGTYTARGEICSNGTDGLIIIGRDGATNDLILANGSGNTVMQVPSGTTTVQFLGAATMAGISSTADIGVAKSAAGNAAILSAEQTDNSNTSSHARLQATTGGASGGDPYTRYTVTGVTDWSIGIDNSDSDAFVITPSTTPGGAANGLRISTAGAVTIPGTLGVTGVATFTAAPIFSSVTASQFLLVDGSKALTSVAGTGSGSVVRATSPTITAPTLTGLTTSTGGIKVDGGTLGDPNLFSNATDGLVIMGRAGASYDLQVLNSNGIAVARVPLATLNIQFLGDVDITGPRFTVPRSASAPSSPANGMIYYDTTQNHFFFRSNGAWVEIA